VLSAIAIGATALFVAFKAWAVVSGIIDGVRAAMVTFAATGEGSAIATAAAWVLSAATTVASFVAMAAAATAAFIAENLATLGIVAAIAAVVAAIVYMATHWSQVWGEVKQVASDVGTFLDNLFHNQIVQDILAIWSLGLVPLAEHWTTVWGDIQTTAEGFWNWLSQTFGTDLAGFFTKTIPGWWDDCVAGAKLFATNVQNAITAVWTWLSGTFGTDISNFFTKTVPGWFDTFISATNSHFVTPFENAVKGAWDWVTTNVFNPMETFITKTVPGWFDTAVSAINTAWDKIETDVEIPVKFVVNDILNPLGQAFDDITNALGLGKPIPKISMAAGGKVRKLPGFGGGDIIPALLEPGESVVDKNTTASYAWLFKALGVPGFASGGVAGGGPIGLITQGLDLLSGLIGGHPSIGSVLTFSDVSAALGKIAGKGVGGATGALGSLLAAAGKTAVSDMMSFLNGKAASLAAPITGGPGGGAPSANAALAKKLYPPWATGSNWNMWNAIAMAESGWSNVATNPGSGAYGIPQALPYTKMPKAAWPPAAGGSANPTAQIMWMVQYILGGGHTWGSGLAAAYNNEMTQHWYGQGGMISEPVIGFGASGQGYRFGERGPELVSPGGGATLADVIRAVNRLTEVTAAVPLGVGQHMSGAIGGASAAASFRNRYPRGGA